MVEQLNCIIFGMFLLAAAWEDGRKKSISIWLLLIGGVAGIVLSLLQREDSFKFTGCLVGFALLAVSKLTKNSVGTGDGCFFIISGLFLPALSNLILFFYGISLSGIFCGLFFLLNRVKGINVGKERIPFIPFLVPVWLIMVLR
jgi:leader peptidase (prepilin peptidase)/N-methyltransferase